MLKNVSGRLVLSRGRIEVGFVLKCFSCHFEHVPAENEKSIFLSLFSRSSPIEPWVKFYMGVYGDRQVDKGTPCGVKNPKKI